MLLADDRIELNARPAAAAQSVLEVVMLGHCPARSTPLPGTPSPFDDGQPHTLADALRHTGNIRWERLARDEMMLTEIAQLGFAVQTTRLRTLLAHLDSNTPLLLQADDAALLELYNLPIPLYAFAQFQALFPDAFDAPTQYRSVLAGARAWLPLAVQDFFDNSVTGQTLKLWIIRVPELHADHATPTHNHQAFLPRSEADMLDIASLGAFDRALLIPRAAIIALPDLERLQIPAHLEDIPRLRLKNPEPVFLPCSSVVDDGHRERRQGDEIPAMPDPLPARDILVPIARTLGKRRPDMQCLLSVALAALPASERPGADMAFLDQVAQAAALDSAGSLTDTTRGSLADASRHLQLLFPYLRGPDRNLATAVGKVAGMQAQTAQSHGPWRSIAGKPLPGRSLPWPPLTQQQRLALRTRPGVTVLQHRAGHSVIDDERLCAPCLPAIALQQLSPARRNQEHWRSAEILRFMGWLRRELQFLGERMIFDTDPRDARPALALRAFFARLHSLGALRGRRVEDSFTLTPWRDGDSAIGFDIDIAPAFPIDRLRISFLQDRHSSQAGTRIGIAHG